MIKLGIFGDQTTNQQLLRQINMLHEVEIAGLFFSGTMNLSADYCAFSSPTGLMDVSDAILVLTGNSISNDLIKLILRKSKPIFLQSVPSLHIKEIRELVDLEKEAGIVTSIYNPFIYNPFFNTHFNNYQKPFLINIRTYFDHTIRPLHELLLLVAASNRMAQSNFKKLDVFGIKAANNFVVDIRLEYENGCVVSINCTQEKRPGICEIIQKSGISVLKVRNSLYSQSKLALSEVFSIENFIQMIMSRDVKNNSFDGLMQSVQIVHEIKEHLRFNEIIF